MQETTKSPDKDGGHQYRIDQLDALAKNMIRLFDQGAKAVSTMAERSNGQGPYNVVSEANEAAKSPGKRVRDGEVDASPSCGCRTGLVACAGNGGLTDR